MHHPGLGAWMRKRRLKTPRKIALIYGEGSAITYAQLADRADGVSSLLSSRGIGKGDSVAYIGENSPEFLAALFGCAQVGAVFVPINTRLAPPEILHILADCRARVLIRDPEFAERTAPLISAVRIAHVVETSDLTDGSPGTPGAVSAEVDTAPDDPAAVIYTSGTTGRAKGAVLTHQNLTWVALNCLVDYDIVSSDVALMISPLFHVASLGMGALPVILKGGTIVLEKGFDPGRALRLIAEHGVTMLSGVPTTYQLMADHPDWEGTDLSTLTKLTCGGSAVPTRILNAYEERGLSLLAGVRHDRDIAGRDIPLAVDDAIEAGQRRSAALLHRRADRRDGGAAAGTAPSVKSRSPVRTCSPAT